jgi:Right handed beta helix region
MARLGLLAFLAGIHGPAVNFAVAQNSPPLVILVAPVGVDRPLAKDSLASGQAGPVRTLQYAVDLARDLRRANPSRSAVDIELAPGEHRLDRPVRLTAEHGGSHGQPLVIRGSAGGTTKLKGSRKLEPIAAAGDGAKSAMSRPEINTEARPHLRRYSLPSTLKPAASMDTPRPQDRVPAVPFEVFDAGGPLRPARWPNTGWARVVTAGGTALPPTFTISSERVKTWQGEPDLWAGGYWQYDWRYETQAIIAINPASSIMTLAALPFEGIKAGARMFVYHALSELDEPGEWYRDRVSNELLVWPRDLSELEISVSESAFEMTGVSHLRLQNLTIEMTRGDAVFVKGGRDVVIEDCTIRWTGGRAITFEDAAASGILRSHVTGTGAGGVLLYGGDRIGLVPAGLFALDTRFERFARLSLTYAAAVELDGVGNSAIGNFITDADHEGIEFRGNDHLIERNEMSRLMLDSADGGAIYTGRDWTARGTRIRHNFIRDVRPAPGMETKGIYLDDMASGIIIEGNVFLRVDQAVFVGGGYDNQVTGNVFVATDPALHIDSRGIDFYRERIDDPKGELRTRLDAMPYRSEPWRSRYPTLPGLLDDQPYLAKRNVMAGNLYLTQTPNDIDPGTDQTLQTFTPNLGVADLGAKVLERAGKARRAAELADILRPALKASPLRDLPFESMDRADWLSRGTSK